MELWTQLAWGTLILSLCSALHLALILGSIDWLRLIAQDQSRPVRRHRAGLTLAFALLVVVIGHTAQVWLWALSYMMLGALDALEPALYFALSNYTTLGYGDLVLEADLRLFAAFASVNGMLIFGVSTAYLVGVLGRLLPNRLRPPDGPT